MKEGPDIAMIAALIGDPARANILAALMAGKALTATELSFEAGVTAQTASAHLAKLRNGNLVTQRKQGRHRYYSLASPQVANVIEQLMGLAAQSGHLRTRTGPQNEALREARVCYNHLAGSMATRLYESLLQSDKLKAVSEGIDLTDRGEIAMLELGIELQPLRKSRSVLCRECLDWSERRSHLGGALGREILHRIEELEWVRRDPASRAVFFSPLGRAKFERLIAER